MELNAEILMELMDREREHGRMLQEQEALHELINRNIAEALELDERHGFDHYKNLDSVTVKVGDIATVTGYYVPEWLMKKARKIKEEREEK